MWVVLAIGVGADPMLLGVQLVRILSGGEPSGIVLAVDEASPSAARSFVAGVIESWGLRADDDVTLLTSEAVTNSVQHADTASVVLIVSHVGGRARIEVLDDDPAMPALIAPDPWRASGKGVALIQTLSTAWGVEEVLGDGKRLWFEVELTESGPASAASSG